MGKRGNLKWSGEDRFQFPPYQNFPYQNQRKNACSAVFFLLADSESNDLPDQIIRHGLIVWEADGAFGTGIAGKSVRKGFDGFRSGVKADVLLLTCKMYQIAVKHISGHSPGYFSVILGEQLRIRLRSFSIRSLASPSKPARYSSTVRKAVGAGVRSTSVTWTVSPGCLPILARISLRMPMI